MNTFSLQTRLYSGPGSLKVISRFSHKHIWIICDVFLARSPLINTLHQALPDSNRLSIFSEITPDPTIQTVVKGIAQMQTLRPDGLSVLAAVLPWTPQKRLSGSVASVALKLKPA